LAVDGERSCAVSRHHGNLAVSLIEGIRQAVDATGVDRLIQARQETMVASYCNVLAPLADISDRACEPP
jgi:predicted ArsR family transcriptional regulator